MILGDDGIKAIADEIFQRLVPILNSTMIRNIAFQFSDDNVRFGAGPASFDVIGGEGFHEKEE